MLFVETKRECHKVSIDLKKERGQVPLFISADGVYVAVCNHKVTLDLKAFVELMLMIIEKIKSGT